jgi:cysteine-rich CPXCG protein
MELIAETEIACPHCGGSFPLEIDTSQPEQSIIEDCTVCCRPITLTIRCRPGVVVNLVTVDV